MGLSVLCYIYLCHISLNILIPHISIIFVIIGVLIGVVANEKNPFSSIFKLAGKYILHSRSLELHLNEGCNHIVQYSAGPPSEMSVP